MPRRVGISTIMGAVPEEFDSSGIYDQGGHAYDYRIPTPSTGSSWTSFGEGNGSINLNQFRFTGFSTDTEVDANRWRGLSLSRGGNIRSLSYGGMMSVNDNPSARLSHLQLDSSISNDRTPCHRTHKNCRTTTNTKTSFIPTFYPFRITRLVREGEATDELTHHYDEDEKSTIMYGENEDEGDDTNNEGDTTTGEGDQNNHNPENSEEKTSEAHNDNQEQTPEAPKEEEVHNDKGLIDSFRDNITGHGDEDEAEKKDEVDQWGQFEHYTECMGEVTMDAEERLSRVSMRTYIVCRLL